LQDGFAAVPTFSRVVQMPPTVCLCPTPPTNVTIPEDQKVTIDVPAEVPTGDAEVIVLSSASVGAPQPADTTFAARFRPNPALGPIIFHEDPTLPVSEEDWPSDLRP
jgi:hypothetical protein